MSSLMTCSGQGVVVQGRKNEKECVVEDIRNRSSQAVIIHNFKTTGPVYHAQPASRFWEHRPGSSHQSSHGINIGR